MSVYTPSLEQRLEFAPPKAPGVLPAAVLALLAHLALVAALTWGVQWKNQVDTPAIEAELWSALPQQAAPELVTPREPETPTPPPPPLPPPPEPIVKPVPPPPAADVQELRDAQIALEREKKRAKAEEQRQQALKLAEQKHKQELKQRELEKKAQAEAEALAKEKLAKDKLAKEKRDKEAREREELARKREAEQQQAAKAEKADKAKAQAAKAEADARHKAQVERMLGMAGANGDAHATGTALRSSGPSANYAGRIAARIKPNIVFTEDMAGNPVAEVEVRVAPDGTVVGTPKLLKSSGYKAWDDAVIKAILKTEVLPKDVDGRVPSVITMGFRPKD